jgi:CheY-like chemotaxis protein
MKFLFKLYFTRLTDTMKSNNDTAKDDNTSGELDKLPTPDEPANVMLADDDKEDQELFQEALSETNIPSELTIVENGKDLMENLKDPEVPNPDIIFIDINMPVKNGKQALAEIKADENLKDIPTVMLSTSKNEKEVEETFQAGANLYVPKPNSFSNLIAMLKKIFSLKWTGDLLRPLRKTFLLSEDTLHKRDGN